MLRNNATKIKASLWILIVSIFLMLQWSCSTTYEEQPKMVKGTIDLSTWDFTQSPEINLQGNSLFYWKQWPFDANGNFTPNVLKTADTIAWPTAVSTQNKENPRGYGTYRFLVKRKVSEEKIVIHIPRTLAGAEAWINGKKIVSHGQISKNAQDEKIDGRPFIIELPNEPQLDVMFLFSNHKHRLGGGFPMQNFIKEKSYYTQQYKSASLIEGIISFLIVLFGIYQIIHYFSFPKYKYFLYLGLFCLIGASRQLFMGEGMIYNFFPDISFDFVQKMRYIGYYGGLASVFMYHVVLFPGYFSSKLTKVLVTIPIIGVVYIILTPAYYGTFSAPFFQVFGLIVILLGFYQVGSAVKDKKPYAIGMLISMSITLLVFANDLLNAMMIMQTTFLINYGILFYVGFQIILNSKIQKQTIREISRLSVDIEKMADRIDKKEKEIVELRSETFQQLKSKEKLVENLKKVASNDDSISIQNVIASLKSELLEDTQLTRIKNDIETLNHEFAQRIKTLHPSLTKTDIEICSYLRLSLGRKEIAKLRFTSVDAVKKSRNRIRKKMNLSPTENLEEYIQAI